MKTITLAASGSSWRRTRAAAWRAVSWGSVALVIASCGQSTRPDVSDTPAMDAVGETMTSGAFGASCTRDGDCMSAICLSVGRCSRMCMSGTDCPNSPNWTCVSLPGRALTCDCTARAMTDTPCNGVDDECNGEIDDTSRMCGATCVDVGSDPMNCGNCGIACGGGQTCRAGRCDCPGDRPTVCGTSCVNTGSDPLNCGSCGMACPSGPNGTPTCTMARCGLTCAVGVGDCDGNPINGCETNTASNVMHCGMCGRACNFANAMGTCSTGSCVIGACTAGYGNCDMDATNGCETDTRASTLHCGACGRACAPANGSGRCNEGACELAACNAGFANCDTMDANGCEVNSGTDARNCGTCGRVCPGSGAPNTVAGCAGGMCRFTCAAGFGDCDGMTANGCETDMQTTNAHCGACANVCPATQRCGMGTCVARDACRMWTLGGIGVPGGATATASASYTTYTADRAIDGDLSSFWNAPDYRGWLRLRLSSPIAMRGLRLVVGANPPTMVSYQVTQTGAPTSIGTASASLMPTPTVLPMIALTPGSYGDLTITVNGGAAWVAIYEISIVTDDCP